MGGVASVSVRLIVGQRLHQQLLLPWTDPTKHGLTGSIHGSFSHTVYCIVLLYVCVCVTSPPPGMAVTLKPELFEGLRFDFTKPLNQKFSLSHRYVIIPSLAPVMSILVGQAALHCPIGG